MQKLDKKYQNLIRSKTITKMFFDKYKEETDVAKKERSVSELINHKDEPYILLKVISEV